MKIMRKRVCVVFVLLVFGILLGHEVSAASGISMRDKKISMWQGKTKQLSLVSVSGKQAGKIKWKSSNGSLVSVSKKGKVKAKKAGKATVTAVYKGKKYTCRIRVIKQTKKTRSSSVTGNTKVADVMNHPVFRGYGRLLFPVDFSIPKNMKLGEIDELMPYHNYVRTDTTVKTVKHLINRVGKGGTVFYDIYTEKEKKADPQKKNTGLIFFKGKPGRKFAVVNAGGGWSYVGAMHESFPAAMKLSKKGYNAFALIYRSGGEKKACQDLARAITFIFRHADELQVDVSGYSLWGGSAGARMAANLGSYGPEGYGEKKLPHAGAVIMQYMEHSDYTKQDPPTFACVGKLDGIADWKVMQSRINELKKLGIPTEFHAYGGVEHGFGLGIGTAADGWLKRAVDFWEKNTK